MVTQETGIEAETPETEAEKGFLETGTGVNTIGAGLGHEIDQEAEEEIVNEETVYHSKRGTGVTTPLEQV